MAGKFEILKSANGGFRFNLKAGNGEIIFSSESYESQAKARQGAESVISNASDENRFERKTDKNGASYFVLKAANGEQIGKSETYSSGAAMENGIQSVKNNAAGAVITDATGA
jgi:uncharacterized protein YegP (UPF0339 family)